MHACEGFLLVLCCLFIPFLAVFFRTGCSLQFGINILLCIFFYIPGIIHAFYICFFSEHHHHHHHSDHC
uniref:Plasma membrane proteolipid 3 n=1 Tax=Rhabditophanes sp. KR3021 TaxID=114890 RepID=A0AC35UI75_9BILA